MHTLVTGAAGFIGSRMVEFLHSKNVPVISVDKTQHFETRSEHAGFHFGQILDRDELWNWLGKNRPPLQCIIHMGACSNTMELDEDFLRKVNLEYSQKLWTYAAAEKIPFVYASSGATYGAGELGYDDDEALFQKLKPLNPYGESKRLFDLWVLEQEKLKHTPPTWSGFKFFNVYGFGERHKTKMASVALHAYDQILKSGSLKLFKSHRPDIAHGHQKRDFIAVEDVVKVLDFAMGKPISRGIFNLGSGQASTFLDLGKAVFAALGKPEKIEFIDTPEILRSRYQYFTEAKMARLRKEGYTAPFTSLESGILEYMKRLRRFDLLP